MPGTREVREGVQVQSPTEEIPYAVDFEEWPNPPTAPTVTAVDEDDADATTTLFGESPTPSVSGNVVTLPLCSGGVAENIYTVTVGYTYNVTAKLECVFKVRFE